MADVTPSSTANSAEKPVIPQSEVETKADGATPENEAVTTDVDEAADSEGAASDELEPRPNATSSPTKNRIIAAVACVAVAAVAFGAYAAGMQPDTQSAAQTSTSSSAASNSEIKSTSGGAAASSQSSALSSAASASSAAAEASSEASTQQNSDTAQTATETTTENTPNSSSSSQADGKVWVEPVYEEVHHEEVGHWETQYVDTGQVVCNCGAIFNSVDEQRAHQQAYIDEMRQTDPDFQCVGDHALAGSYREEQQVWVVDVPAWTERVLVKEGYWK